MLLLGKITVVFSLAGLGAKNTSLFLDISTVDKLELEVIDLIYQPCLISAGSVVSLKRIATSSPVVNLLVKLSALSLNRLSVQKVCLEIVHLI